MTKEEMLKETINYQKETIEFLLERAKVIWNLHEEWFDSSIVVCECKDTCCTVKELNDEKN